MRTKNRITEEFLGYKSVISALLRKLSFVSNPDIEDILQETYIRTYQSALEQEIRFPKAFMVKTALRLANRQKHKSSVVDTSSNGDIESLYDELDAVGNIQKQAETPEQEYIKLEEFRLLCSLINELPPQCRKVLIMKKIYGLSQRDIAQSLRLSESTVEKHIAKGILYCGRNLNKMATNPQSSTSDKNAVLSIRD